MRRHPGPESYRSDTGVRDRSDRHDSPGRTSENRSKCGGVRFPDRNLLADLYWWCHPYPTRLGILASLGRQHDGRSYGDDDHARPATPVAHSEGHIGTESTEVDRERDQHTDGYERPRDH